MVNKLFFIFAFFMSIVLQCKIVGAAEAVYPRLAIFHDGKIVVPTGENNNNPPKELRAFVLPAEEGNKPIPDSSIVQFDQSLMMSNEMYIFYGCKKADFYRKGGVGNRNDELAIVFESKLPISSELEGKIALFKNKKSGSEWKIVRVAGTEGMNYFLQEFKAGQCVSHQRYYGYFGYDIEQDPDDAFDKASCGVEVDILCPECVH